MTPAQIIWKQIPVMTKMACGARKARTVGENTLTFQVTNKPMRYVKVEYQPGPDHYDVTHLRVKRGTYEQIELEKAEGVYAEDLGETIYHQVNK